MQKSVIILPAIFGIKAIAHLLIILFHTTLFCGMIFGTAQWQQFWYQHHYFLLHLVGNCNLAVDVLFLITAYFATREYVLIMQKKCNFLPFLMQRLLRLLPLLWLVCILVTPALPQNQLNIIYDMMCISNYRDMRVSAFGVVWSICCDVQYHILVLPWIVPVFMRFSKHKNVVFGIAVAICIGIRCYAAMQVPVQEFRYSLFGFSMIEAEVKQYFDWNAPLVNALYNPLHARLLPFICGTFIACKQHDAEYEKKHNSWTVYHLVAILGILYALFGMDAQHQHDEYTLWHFWYVVLRIPVFSLSIMYLLLPYFDVHFHGTFSNMLQWSFWHTICRVMYPSYLIHSFVIVIVLQIVQTSGILVPLSLVSFATIYLLCCVITIPMAQVLHRFVEAPCNRWRKSKRE